MDQVNAKREEDLSLWEVKAKEVIDECNRQWSEKDKLDKILSEKEQMIDSLQSEVTALRE